MTNTHRAVAIAPQSLRPEVDQTQRPVVSALRIAAEILSKLARYDGPGKVRTSRYGNSAGGHGVEIDDHDVDMARQLMARFEALPSKVQRQAIAFAVAGHSVATIARRLALPLPIAARELERGLDYLEGRELSYNSPGDFFG